MAYTNTLALEFVAEMPNLIKSFFLNLRQCVLLGWRLALGTCTFPKTGCQNQIIGMFTFSTPFCSPKFQSKRNSKIVQHIISLNISLIKMPLFRLNVIDEATQGYL